MCTVVIMCTAVVSGVDFMWPTWGLRNCRIRRSNSLGGCYVGCDVGEMGFALFAGETKSPGPHEVVGAKVCRDE